VGITSLWIASKYHEIYPPSALNMVHISNYSFAKDCLINMECRICDVLNYRFSIPNAFQFLDRYTNVTTDFIKEQRLKNRVKYLARYGMERFNADKKALEFNPSMLAAGALYTALKLTSHSWSRSCEICSGYSEMQLAPKVLLPGEDSLFELIKRSVLDFYSPVHRAIISKYKTVDRGSVSTIRMRRGMLIDHDR